MGKTTHYDRHGRVMGSSDTPDRPRKLTEAEEKAAGEAIGFALALFVGTVALAPILAPFLLFNLLLSSLVMMWHPFFIILVFGAANLAFLCVLYFALIAIPSPVLKASGATVYAVYGFAVAASMTSSSKWSIASTLPAGFASWTGPLQNGDIIWSVFGSVVAALFGWFLFGKIKRLVS